MSNGRWKFCLTPHNSCWHCTTLDSEAIHICIRLYFFSISESQWIFWISYFLNLPALPSVFLNNYLKLAKWSAFNVLSIFILNFQYLQDFIKPQQFPKRYEEWWKRFPKRGKDFSGNSYQYELYLQIYPQPNTKHILIYDVCYLILIIRNETFKSIKLIFVLKFALSPKQFSGFFRCLELYAQSFVF